MPPFRRLDQLQVHLEQVVYAPQLEAPSDKPYPFVYHIRIENRSEETFTIKGRKWVITEANGHQAVIEGDGVVGRFPAIAPGGSFSYHSYHVVASDSVAVGAFFAVNEEGEPGITMIPRFEMQIP